MSNDGRRNDESHFAGETEDCIFCSTSFGSESKIWKISKKTWTYDPPEKIDGDVRSIIVDGGTKLGVNIYYDRARKHYTGSVVEVREGQPTDILFAPGPSECALDFSQTRTGRRIGAVATKLRPYVFGGRKWDEFELREFSESGVELISGQGKFGEIGLSLNCEAEDGAVYLVGRNYPDAGRVYKVNLDGKSWKTVFPGIDDAATLFLDKEGERIGILRGVGSHHRLEVYSLASGASLVNKPLNRRFVDGLFLDDDRILLIGERDRKVRPELVEYSLKDDKFIDRVKLRR